MCRIITVVHKHLTQLEQQASDISIILWHMQAVAADAHNMYTMHAT